jgi:hypothetical protein
LTSPLHLDAHGLIDVARARPGALAANHRQRPGISTAKRIKNDVYLEQRGVSTTRQAAQSKKGLADVRDVDVEGERLRRSSAGAAAAVDAGAADAGNETEDSAFDRIALDRHLTLGVTVG